MDLISMIFFFGLLPLVAVFTIYVILRFRSKHSSHMRVVKMDEVRTNIPAEGTSRQTVSTKRTANDYAAPISGSATVASSYDSSGSSSSSSDGGSSSCD